MNHQLGGAAFSIAIQSAAPAADGTMNTYHREPESTTESAPNSAISANDSQTEDQALAQLKNRDLPPEQIEGISRNTPVMKSRKVRLALAAHPHSPRHLALHLVREFYTFELTHFALTSGPAPDLKRLADEVLVHRLPSVTLGERISLARRSSSRVAAALLLDKEARVWRIALDNARLNEAGVVRALQHAQVSPAFVQQVCCHGKWSLRREVRIALLQTAHTPLARALEFARGFPPAQLRDILYASRLPEKTKECVRQTTESRRRTKI